MSFTVSYQTERALVFVLLNLCQANITLHLMLTNMSKKPFKSMLQPAYLYPLVPVLASWVFGSDYLVLVLTRLMVV